MEIKEYNGSILESKAQIIVHQVNCQAAMGSGVAKCIKDKWPIVYDEYMNFCHFDRKWELLGEINIVKVSNKQAVCNLFGQYNYGYDNKRYTSYDGLCDGFEKLKSFCQKYSLKSIAVPVNIGCGLGGGNWNIVNTIITETFKDTDVIIEFWKYETK